jgi:hypothetical protein
LWKCCPFSSSSSRCKGWGRMIPFDVFLFLHFCDIVKVAIIHRTI